MKFSFACFALFCFAGLKCLGQSHHLVLDKLTTDNGMPHNFVGRVLQDSFGYIWMATDKGVVRYDGYKPYVYRLPSSKNKHNSVGVFDLLIDKQGSIWASSSFGGVYRYNRASDHFIQYTHNDADPHSLPYTNAYGVVQGNGNDIWVISYLRAGAKPIEAVSVFNPKTNGFVNYGYAQKGKYHLDCKFIFQVFKDNQGKILISTDSGLYRLNSTTRQFDKYPGLAGIDFAHSYYHIFRQPGDDQNIWLCSVFNGVIKFNLTSGRFTAFKHSAAAGSLPNDSVRAVITDNQHRVWVSAPGGMGLLNPQTGKFTSYPFVPNDSLKVKPLFWRFKFDGHQTIWLSGQQYLARFNLVSLTYQYYIVPQEDNVADAANLYNVLIDSSRNVWITNGSAGIGRINTLRSAFNLQPINKQHFSPTFVAAFLPVSATVCYLAAEDGLYTWDLNAGTITKVKEVAGGTDNYLIALAQNKDGLVAVGMPDALGIFNPATKQFKIEKNDPRDPNSFSGEDSRAIVADPNGDFWVGTGNKGVKLYNPHTGKFRHFPYNKDIFSKTPNRKWLDGDDAICLYRDKANTIWVGTFDGGINRFNPADSSFTSYFYSNPDITGITAMFEDSKHRFWVGTDINGLFLFDRKSGKVLKQFTEAGGMLADRVEGITEDGHGSLWVSTSMGISVINPSTNKITNYNKANALPDANLSLPCIMPDGRVLYGSRKGLISFYFDDIKPNPYPPKVHIESVFHNNPKSASLNTDTLFTLTDKQAELPYNQNQVTFNFVALHYSNPSENEYAYQLEGFDKKWISTKTQRSVTYNNMSPGTYTFRVRAASSDGVWNNTGDKFVLTITAPLWFRWWAWVLYVAVFTAALRAYLQYRSRRLVRENQLLEEKIALRTSELSQANTELNEQREEITAQRDQVSGTLKKLEQTQSQLVQAEKMASMGELTAGIAHEIQNPLNFVNNFSDVSIELITEMEDEMAKGEVEEAGFIAADIKQNLQKINHHGKRADGIVKAMLQHSRSSSNNRELSDLNALADEYLRLAYHGLRAKNKTFNALLTTTYDERLPQVSLVPQDIGRVLLNLYNNAFYALNDQQKTLGPDFKPEIKVTTTHSGSRIRLAVWDNGAGITDAIKNKILQPFFTTKPTGEGTGLGLSISYDIIVKSHGGELLINSEPGVYTEFIMVLPLRD